MTSGNLQKGNIVIFIRKKRGERELWGKERREEIWGTGFL